MRDAPAYEFRFGDLYNVGRGARICATGESLALAVGSDGTVYKHGVVDAVRKWSDVQAAKQGVDGLTGGMSLIVFPATEESVAALNGLIAGRGGAEHFMERLSALAPLPPRPF